MTNLVNAQAMTPAQLAALLAANPAFVSIIAPAIGAQAGVGNPTIATAVAAGNGQSTASILAASTNILVSGSGGVVLKSGSSSVTVINRTTQPALVYPPAGQQIETDAINAPVEIAVGGSATFVYGNGTWFAY